MKRFCKNGFRSITPDSVRCFPRLAALYLYPETPFFFTFTYFKK